VKKSDSESSQLEVSLRREDLEFGAKWPPAWELVTTEAVGREPPSREVEPGSRGLAIVRSR
jgi:hypothetical protein